MYRSLILVTFSSVILASPLAFAAEGGPSNNGHGTKIEFDYSTDQEKNCVLQQARILEKIMGSDASLKKALSDETNSIRIQSDSVQSKNVEGVLLPSGPDEDGDKVGFDKAKRTLTIFSGWNTETKKCEPMKSGKYISYAVEGSIDDILSKELGNYFPSKNLSINAWDGWHTTYFKDGTWSSTYENTGGDKELDYKRGKVFHAGAYNDHGDLDRKCALSQARELNKAIASNVALGNSIKKEDIKFELDFRTNYETLGLVDDFDPKVLDKFKYDSKRKTIFLLPLYKKFTQKQWGQYGSIPKVTCEVMPAQEIERRLAKALNVSKVLDNDDAAVKQALQGLFDAKNGQVDSTPEVSIRQVKPATNIPANSDSENSSGSAASPAM